MSEEIVDGESINEEIKSNKVEDLKTEIRSLRRQLNAVSKNYDGLEIRYNIQSDEYSKFSRLYDNKLRQIQELKEENEQLKQKVEKCTCINRYPRNVRIFKVRG